MRGCSKVGGLVYVETSCFAGFSELFFGIDVVAIFALRAYI